MSTTFNARRPRQRPVFKHATPPTRSVEATPTAERHTVIDLNTKEVKVIIVTPTEVKTVYK